MRSGNRRGYGNREEQTIAMSTTYHPEAKAGIDRQLINEVVRRVVGELEVRTASDVTGQTGRMGVFDSIEDAIEAAHRAFLDLLDLPLATRSACIAAVRTHLLAHVDELAELAVRETGMGRVAHKKRKNRLAIERTPGTEFLTPSVFTGDHGLSLVEHPPYGVIGAITPSTNPSETVINNGIAMFAGGNTAVFNGHPSAAETTARTVELINTAVVRAGGPENTVTCAARPTKESGLGLMQHPLVRILVVTGGPEIVRIAMSSGKKVIAAGPGNPPAIVDETAQIDEAARDLVAGAGLDNNIVCIAEKEIVVVDSVADRLIEGMEENGAVRISLSQLDRLMDTITTKTCTGSVAGNRDFVGKNARVILEAIGIKASDETPIAIAEVAPDHPLVHWEQLMPIIPVVRVRDFDAGLDLAYRAEAGRFHTAMIHSMNVDHLSRMARKMNCTVFVKNGPCYAGLGMEGEGYTSWTLASPTGEGYTNPLTYTRNRRCVLKDQFRIV